MKDRDENDDECWLGTVGWHCIHCLVRKRARPEKALQSCAALRCAALRFAYGPSQPISALWLQTRTAAVMRATAPGKPAARGRA